jgi:hypothetical protein
VFRSGVLTTRTMPSSVSSSDHAARTFLQRVASGDLSRPQLPPFRSAAVCRLSFGGAIAGCRRDAEISASQKQLASNGYQESSRHAIKVAAHMGALGWHRGKAVYARKGVTDATIRLNHSLREISIDFAP